MLAQDCNTGLRSDLYTKLATNQWWRRSHAFRWTRVSGELPAAAIMCGRKFMEKQRLVIYH